MSEIATLLVVLGIGFLGGFIGSEIVAPWWVRRHR